MTWAAGDQAQCIRKIDNWCEHCQESHGEVPQYLNVYRVTHVFVPGIFEMLLGARPGPYLVFGEFQGAFWHENFRKVEPLPPEPVEDEVEREKEVVT